MMIQKSDSYRAWQTPAPFSIACYAISARYLVAAPSTRLDALNFMVDKIMAEDADLLRELANR